MAKPAMVPVNIPAAYLNVELQLVIKELFRGGRLDDLNAEVSALVRLKGVPHV